MAAKKGILERLKDGEVIVGDGGLAYCLERRGYLTVGLNTPEVVIEYPSAVHELHREFALCGSDVLQAFVFYGNNDKLNVGRNQKNRLCSKEINNAGCKLVKDIASVQDCLVAFPVTTTTAYQEKLGKEKVQAEFQQQVDVFKEQKPDLVISEFISTIEETEWAVEVLKEVNVPIASTICIGPLGDLNGVSVEECGIRMAKSGADIIGVNCRFGPMVAVETIKRMKRAVENEGLSVHYMTQPMGYRIPADTKLGSILLPEWPMSTESRLISRWDAQKYARAAYEAGVRYIGGCCGFQPYHIRALAEELCDERGRLPKNSRSKDASTLKYHTIDFVRERANKEYWYNVVPGSGRD